MNPIVPEGQDVVIVKHLIPQKCGRVPINQVYVGMSPKFETLQIFFKQRGPTPSGTSRPVRTICATTPKSLASIITGSVDWHMRHKTGNGTHPASSAGRFDAHPSGYDVRTALATPMPLKPDSSLVNGKLTDREILRSDSRAAQRVISSLLFSLRSCSGY